MIPTHYLAQWTEHGQSMSRLIVRRRDARLFLASMLIRGIRVTLTPNGF